jgi:hypothetical protein
MNVIADIYRNPDSDTICNHTEKELIYATLHDVNKWNVFEKNTVKIKINLF